MRPVPGPSVSEQPGGTRVGEITSVPPRYDSVLTDEMELISLNRRVPRISGDHHTVAIDAFEQTPFHGYPLDPRYMHRPSASDSPVSSPVTGQAMGGEGGKRGAGKR